MWACVHSESSRISEVASQRRDRGLGEPSAFAAPHHGRPRPLSHLQRSRNVAVMERTIGMLMWPACGAGNTGNEPPSSSSPSSSSAGNRLVQPQDCCLMVQCLCNAGLWLGRLAAADPRGGSRRGLHPARPPEPRAQGSAGHCLCRWCDPAPCAKGHHGQVGCGRSWSWALA